MVCDTLEQEHRKKHGNGNGNGSSRELFTKPDVNSVCGVDMNKKYFLGAKAMERFALTTGFDEGETGMTWSDTYATLCEEYDATPEEGLDLENFKSLCDMYLEEDAYTDMLGELLQTMVAELNIAPEGSKRGEVAAAQEAGNRSRAGSRGGESTHGRSRAGSNSWGLESIRANRSQQRSRSSSQGKHGEVVITEDVAEAAARKLAEVASENKAEQEAAAMAKISAIAVTAASMNASSASIEGMSNDNTITSTAATTTTSTQQNNPAFKTPAKNKQNGGHIASFHNVVSNYPQGKEPLATPDTEDRAGAQAKTAARHHVVDAATATLPKPIQEYKKVQLKLNKCDKIGKKQTRGEKLDALQVQMLEKKDKFEIQLKELEEKMDLFLNSGVKEATAELRAAYGPAGRKARGGATVTEKAASISSSPCESPCASSEEDQDEPAPLAKVIIDGEKAQAAQAAAALNRHVTTTSQVTAGDDSDDDEVMDTIDDANEGMDQYYDGSAYM